MHSLRVVALMSCLAAVLALDARPETPANLEIASATGRKFYSQPDEKGVVAAAQKNLAADPKNAGLLLKLAQAQASVWQDREAVETLGRAIEIAPDDAALYTERGHRELPLREFARALADLNRAVELNPRDVEAYYHLGLAHYFLGEFAPAAEAFQHAVELAPNIDSKINSTNWVYASLRRARKPEDAAKALAAITPEMKNTDPHTDFYLTLVRFFQGRMNEAEAAPRQPAAGSADNEAELRFDTVSYGIGNWYLYNDQPAKAQQYFRRVADGHVWITWGFVGAETELLRMQAAPAPKFRRRTR
jgi:tetratricopeptide (TPR) repeat protein